MPKRSTVPEHLNDQAKAAWRALWPCLNCRAPDQPTLALLEVACVAWSRYLEACEKLGAGAVVTLPNGISAASPWVGIANQAQREFRAALKDLALMPANRGTRKVDSETPLAL